MIIRRAVPVRSRRQDVNIRCRFHSESCNTTGHPYHYSKVRLPPGSARKTNRGKKIEKILGPAKNEDWR